MAGFFLAWTENRVFGARRVHYPFRQFSPAQTLKGNMISGTRNFPDRASLHKYDEIQKLLFKSKFHGAFSP
jgi:hypothetical protein